MISHNFVCSSDIDGSPDINIALLYPTLSAQMSGIQYIQAEIPEGTTEAHSRLQSLR